jgi:hypothetical protein
VYWRHGDWLTTTDWLKKVIAAAADKSTFYSDMAKARLDNMHR